MRSPEDIKKGLEHCATVVVDCIGCIYRDECMEGYNNAPIQRDAIAYIQRLEGREWELFDLLSSAWFGKQCYFKQDDGAVYSRTSGEYMTFDQAIDEFAGRLCCDDTDKAQVPKWISVEERLPENDANYLVFTSDANEVDLATYYGDGEWLTPDLCNLTRFVTHWMPLPEWPKEG